MRPFLPLLLSGLILTIVHTKEDSIEELLETFALNSDLSKQTKLAKAGNVTVLTRKMLENIQARNLKDVLKSLPMMNYAESRWGIPDPNYVTQELALNSNDIRIYIDDQEVSSAPYGSGLLHIGDINIGFVDHIEIYTQNPSFEYATEPARILIKLYSKTVQRDQGMKLESSLGSRGFNQESFQYAHTVDAVSYFTYGSRLDDKKKSYTSFDSPMSRDQKRYFFFSKVSTDEHLLQFHAIKNTKDMMMGLSSNGISEKANVQTERFHLGYENRSIENLKLSAVLESGTIENEYIANFQSLEYDVIDRVVTLDAQYKQKNQENNELIIGAKTRYKYFSRPKFIFNKQYPEFNYDKQLIGSLYLEDHYAINDQSLITLGLQGSHVKNNFTVKDQNVWMTRTGFIYNHKEWISKTFFHHSSFLIEPYIYVNSGPYTAQNIIKPEELTSLSQELQYEHQQHKIRTLLSYNYKNKALYIKSHKLINKSDSESTVLSQLEYQYLFNVHHSLHSNFSYMHHRNPYKGEMAKGYDEYKMTLRLLNRFQKFNVFNEFIYNKNSLIKRNYLDYSAGVKYQYSDKLTFSFKGENIFNRAREDLFERNAYNLQSQKWEDYTPLYIAPIDQRFYLTMEYFF